MIIDSRLRQQVTEHPYPLLFVTISGAHLFGFPSPDADYDLRGVHLLPLQEVVDVDVFIYGCPVRKEEVERIVCDLVVGKAVRHPQYPVCMECSAKGVICLYEHGEICLGPVTRGGCDAWCPDSGSGCQGCRGPAEAADPDLLLQIVTERSLPRERFLDMLECFGGFEKWAEQLREGFSERDASTGEQET